MKHAETKGENMQMPEIPADLGKLTDSDRKVLAEQIEKYIKEFSDNGNGSLSDEEQISLYDKAFQIYPSQRNYALKIASLYQKHWQDSMMFQIYHEDSYTTAFNEDTDTRKNYLELLEMITDALGTEKDISNGATAHLYYLRALILQEMKELKNALDAIEAALCSVPDRKAYKEKKVEILYDAGLYPEALQYIEQELQSYDDDRSLAWLKTKIKIACGVVLDDESSNLDDSRLDIYFKEKQFSVIQRVFESIAEPLFIDKWWAFWTYIQQGAIVKAESLLNIINLEGNLTTKASDYIKMEFVIANSTEVNNDQSDGDKNSKPEKEHHFSIRTLYQHEIPFESLPIGLFVKLLNKVFAKADIEQHLSKKVETLQKRWASEQQLIDVVNQYGIEYRDYSIMIDVLEEIAPFSFELKSEMVAFFTMLQVSMNKRLLSAMHVIMNKVKNDERNRILSNLSHSIKNILKSVIDPLMALRDEFPENKATINNAIKGANLIREMVNSVNLSYKATLEDLVWDIKHPGEGAISLQTMIWDSIRYSVSNMFDFRYFPVYAENYFPQSISKAEYTEIEEEWDAVSASDDTDDLVRFIEKHMFHLKLNIDQSVHYQIGNEKSSAIKLMILFQEIIFNAVKYSSFIPKNVRFIDVSLCAQADKLHLEVINSFDPQIRAKTTGVGKVVIENFSKILDTDPIVHRTNDTYQVSLKFRNLWRNNAENIVH